MKKVFSLVALVFVLSSFSLISNAIAVDCFTMAEYNANVILENGGSQAEADETFHDSFEFCANDSGVPTISLK